MSIYNKESVVNFSAAMDSLLCQTYLPTEIILVKDGPLNPELDDAIINYKSKINDLLKVVELTQNKGLGNALGIGLKYCSYDLVARMDTDDICLPERFEKQIKFINDNPQYHVIGSNIEEFNQAPGDLKRFKINPENHDDLVRQIKLKSPFNHPSILFKKKIVLKAGNYNGEFPLFEDYALFLRLWRSGAKFYNIQDVLLNFRVGTGVEMIKRRSGAHYLRKEWNFVKYAKKIGAFDWFDLIKYVVLKFPIRLMSPQLVLFIYNTFLRKKIR